MSSSDIIDISQWRSVPNPYTKRAGFSRRFAYAKRRLEAFGRDCFKRPYSRGFDNCFEMFDGEAIVWALMHHAINGNVDLMMGIRNMGKDVWPRWSAVYNAHKKAWPEWQPRLPLPPP
jgi:hypothetical protein